MKLAHVVENSYGIASDYSNSRPIAINSDQFQIDFEQFYTSRNRFESILAHSNKFKLNEANPYQFLPIPANSRGVLAIWNQFQTNSNPVERFPVKNWNKNGLELKLVHPYII